MTDKEGASNVQPVDQLLPELEGWGKLSYRVSDAPPPVNYHDWYVRAVLIELRLIRKALEKLEPQAQQTKPQAASPNVRSEEKHNPPVETKTPAKK